MDDTPGTGMRVMSAQLSILRNFAVTEARATECSNKYIEALISDGPRLQSTSGRRNMLHIYRSNNVRGSGPNPKKLARR